MKDKLGHKDYYFLLAANFLLYFSFYLIMPVIPFYLKEVFNTGEGMIGIVLSCYTIAALCIRPFSGYLLDTFARKPLYLVSFFVFVAVFAGYLTAQLLAVFIAMRVIHGLAFGTVTVSGNTILIDITPSSRRGEAIGYYGLMNNLAMSFGPMAGMFLHDSYSYTVIFTCSIIFGIAGFICAISVKTKEKPPVKKEPISLDRFFLIKGIPAGFALLLLSIPYGMTSSYVAMYAEQIGIPVSGGLFFTFMAVGMAVSRMFSGRLVDKGKITEVITFGIVLACIAFFALAGCSKVIGHSVEIAEYMFFAVALTQGVAFGTMFPAFNTMFVNLAPNNKRGTATSTYLTSWDVGIGIGMLAGGYIAEVTSFGSAYLFGACLTIISFIFFILKVTPHFHKYKIR